VLRAYEPGQDLSHFEYFRLCLSSHFLTCATPVPTDVDNQIRLKLWPKGLPLESALAMAGLVLESRRWDFSRVSERCVSTLSGHLGEWFTVASGAYCALGQYAAPEAREARQRLFDEIADEVRHHSDVFGALWKAGEGVACLKASATIAHNFGDLDRVMDMWELGVADPLRLEFYQLGVRPFDANGNLRYLGRLWAAGELYKSNIDGSALALENHRHFALRKPRALRRKREFLIPLGPFFDDWGRRVAAGIESETDRDEVVEALRQGLRKMPKTFGYARALLAMGERVQEKPPLAQDRFEKRWREEALRHLDEIPSRAG
jgi:hypothetical protein